MMTTKNDEPNKAGGEPMGLGPVFCYEDQDNMNVAALLKYVQELQHCGKTMDILEFVLAEVEMLLEDGNETIDIDNFTHEVAHRLLYTLE
jgi:hypothetical protein